MQLQFDTSLIVAAVDHPHHHNYFITRNSNSNEINNWR